MSTGGLGAGYILWEFQHDDSRIVTLGFTNSGHYLDRRLSAAITRLGLHADWSRTSGAVRAAAELRRELGAGQPVIVWPDRYLIGYWHLPPVRRPRRPPGHRLRANGTVGSTWMTGLWRR